MRNFARNSKFDIRIDFEKSHDSFLYDKNPNKEYLDLESNDKELNQKLINFF